MLTTDQKGAIAEASIARAAIRLDVGVYKPMFEGSRYDLVFDLGGSLLRVQCKWSPRQGDGVVVRCRSSRRTSGGVRHRAYTAAEVDAIAAYCPELDECYFVPSTRFDGHVELLLRLAPTRNNQSRGINWAADFRFDARLSALLGP